MMRSFLQKRWFLIGLALLITTGLTLGMRNPSAGETLRTHLFRPRMITACVLFLMAFSLESGRLRQSCRRPAPVVWATLVNYGFIPLLTWALMPVQMVPDFRYGLVIAGSVPCTLAAASVWTRKAGGNDAVSLLATLVTNSICFVVTPLWLNLATSQSVELNAAHMVLELFEAVLIPTALGQLLRQIAPLGRFATKHKTPIGVVAQVFVLSLVYMASWKAGTFLHKNGGGPGWGAVILVWGSVILIHVVGMCVALGGAYLLRLSAHDRPAVAFAGSQKTLPIGAFLATDPKIFGDPNLLGAGIGVPFAVFPILMYHASQLFIDTAVADAMAARRNEATEPDRTDRAAG